MPARTGTMARMRGGFNGPFGLLATALVLVVPAHAASPSLLPNLVQLPPSGVVVGRVSGHPALAFASSVANIGTGPLAIRGRRTSVAAPFRVVQVIHRRDGTSVARPLLATLRFVSNPTHEHFHLLGFDTYTLVSADGKRVVRSSKQGFCLGDRMQSQQSAAAAVYTTNCGAGHPGALAVSEGISTGWSDPYAAWREGQAIDVAGLPAGVYDLVNEVNASRSLLESSYADDVAAVKLRLSWPDGTSSAPAIAVLGSCAAAHCPSLDGFDDLAGLEAARADVRPLRLALEQDADALEVRVEAAPRGDHRMAPVVAETGLLPTDCADLGHRRASVAKRV
jgi:hypothetical protein